MRALLVSLILLLPATALAQGFGVRVTPDGMDAITEVAKTRVPNEVVVPSMDRDLYDCPGSSTISAQLPDTPVFIGWNDIRLSTDDGRIIVGVNLDVGVSAMVDLQNPYACFGSAHCDLSANLQNLDATVELAAATGPEGGIEFHGASVDLALAPEDLDLQSDGCAIGEVATWLFNAFEGWALDFLVPRVESMMSDKISEALTDIFAETVGLTVEQGNFEIDGWLDGLDLSRAYGVTAEGDAAITWTGTPLFSAEAPATELPEGEALPNTTQGMFQLAASDRLVTSALYEAWRGGMISQLLADNRQTISLAGVGAVQQIGLPEGTEIDVGLDIEEPLSATFGRVAPDVADLTLRGLHVVIDVRRPEGETSRIDIHVDGGLAARIATAPNMGALVLDIEDLRIDQIRVEGEESELTIDGARLRGFVEGTVMPMISERLSGLPIAPALHEIEGTFLNVREISSDGGWQRVGVDLFVPDPTDHTAPDTSLEEPAALLGAGTAAFTVAGIDDRTPEGLLRYRAWLDHELLTEAPTSLRVVRFDAADGDHVLEVAAVDLNGNADPAPVIHAFTVDGVPPTLRVTESPGAIVLDAAVRASWQAEDDGGRGVTTRWVLRRVAEDSTTSVIQESSFGSDTTLSISTDSLEVGELYELEIIARDEAGNLTSQKFGFALHPSLQTGCSASGPISASPLPVFALLFLGVVLCRRRRR